MTPKTLIIGQGLAGSLLAYRLIEAGISVLVVDPRHRESSSMAAAGLINPITGKRIAKSWLLETLYPAAMDCYAKLEKRFGETFFQPCEAVRLYKDDFERERVAQRRDDAAYEAWLGKKDVVGTPAAVGASEGVPIFGAGWVDLPKLLNCLKHWLIQKSSYAEGYVSPETLDLDPSSVRWQGEVYERVLFCEGYQAKDNPLFSWLPFKPAKGEILSLKTRTASQLNNTLVNRGKWVLPVEEDIVKVGATYGWDPLDCNPTEAARETLLSAYKQLLPGVPEPELFEHKAGVRPATLDAKPLIGKHPEYPHAMLFNGFGSKGSLLIPYFSQHLTHVILGKETLMPEVDIQRYQKG